MSQGEDQWRAADPAQRDALLPRLLVTALYTLVPIGTTPPAWQLWRHPDGSAAVPCFLSEASARVASQGQAQIVRAAGRDIFESLERTCAWIDPHGAAVLLTPQTLRGLLEAMPAPPAIAQDADLHEWSGANDMPPGVLHAWSQLLPHFPHVLTAYWLQGDTPGPVSRRKVVVVTTAAGGDDNHRTLDALSAALRANYAGSLRIEVQAFIQGELPAVSGRLQSVEPFYRADTRH